jgi:hypothetical protein
MVQYTHYGGLKLEPGHKYPWYLLYIFIKWRKYIYKKLVWPSDRFIAMGTTTFWFTYNKRAKHLFFIVGKEFYIDLKNLPVTNVPMKGHYQDTVNFAQNGHKIAYFCYKNFFRFIFCYFRYFWNKSQRYFSGKCENSQKSARPSFFFIFFAELSAD